MFTSGGSSGAGGDKLPEEGGDGRVAPPTADGDELVAAVAAAVDALAADDPAGLGWAGQRERLRALGRLVDRLEAQRVRLLAAADRSGALADDGAATAASWLRRHSTLTASQASERARLARRLAELPVIAAAFAAGDLGVVHVIQVERLCRDVGVDQVAAVQTELVTAAGRLRDVGEFTRLCAGWRHALRPDLADAADDRAYDQRRLSHNPTFGGVFHLAGVFDAEAGATIAAAINAYMTHDPPGTPAELRRTVAQRRADAMYDIPTTALASRDAPDVAGSRPHVVARVNLTDLLATLVSDPDHPDHQRLPGHRRPMATLDWAGPVGPATLARLLGDSTVTRIITNGASQPLDVGTATRVWPAAIRKAITDRDRGCRFDGCDRPAAWCDIDHVIPYTDGGPTAVWNGILLCRQHHRAKRRDGWWPTLHRDGAVTWTHPDGRTRTDPPPATIDNHITTLINATAAAAADTSDIAGDTDTAGQTDPAHGTPGQSSNAPSRNATEDDRTGLHTTAEDANAGYRYPAAETAKPTDAGPTTAGETHGTYHTPTPTTPTTTSAAAPADHHIAATAKPRPRPPPAANCPQPAAIDRPNCARTLTRTPAKRRRWWNAWSRVDGRRSPSIWGDGFSVYRFTW